MKGKTILWVLVAATIGVGGYMLYKKYNWNKQKAIDYLAQNTGEKPESYQSLGEGYLIARAKAMKANQDTYLYEGKTYVTATGRAK